MKNQQMVRIGDKIFVVETLRQWINARMAGIRRCLRERVCGCMESCTTCANLTGRLVELSIIREKINDGRIQEIG